MTLQKTVTSDARLAVAGVFDPGPGLAEASYSLAAGLAEASYSVLAKSIKLPHVKSIIRFRFLALAILAAAFPSFGRAQLAREGGDSATVAALEHTLSGIIRRTEPGVVAVARISAKKVNLLTPQVQDVFGDLRRPPPDEADVLSAGVLIDPAGLVLTEYLAVRDGDRHTITTTDRKTYPATIKAADPRSGLAVLSIDASDTLPIIPLGDAAQLRKGHIVIAIGNPFAIRSDGDPTASWGTVTNLARKAPSGANLNDSPGPSGDYRTTIHHLGTLVQTDAKLGWNSGGGALVDVQGKLVGLTTTVAAIAGHETPAGYAIPIDGATTRIIDTLKQGREVEYGMLGLSFRPNEPASTVQQVFPGTPAARAGLAAGDVVTAVDGREMNGVDSVQLAIGTQPPMQTVTLQYRREGKPGKSSAQLAKLAVSGKVIATDRPPSWRGLRVDYSSALDALALSEQLASGANDEEGCVLVSEVERESPAWKAGTRKGMFISHVGEKRVATPDEFRAATEAASGEIIIRLTQPIRQFGGAETSRLSIEEIQ